MSCCHPERLQKFNIQVEEKDAIIVALAGNPNVGKSTLFNHLTGLRQHTGNWPGKTVTRAHGTFAYDHHTFLIVDLPGTYSLLSNSADEQVAREFILFGQPDLTLVVVDATALERNLNLALQVLEITSAVIVCVNMMDEAKRKGITVDLDQLSALLGVPVVGMSARSNEGIKELKDTMIGVVTQKIQCHPAAVTYSKEVEAAIALLEPEVKKWLKGSPLNSRWVSLRLMDGDESILDSIRKYIPSREKEGVEVCQNMLIMN